MKKTLAVLLVALLVGASIGGCTAEPSSDGGSSKENSGTQESVADAENEKPSELKITVSTHAVTPDLNGVAFMQEVAKKANVKVTFECVASDWVTKKATILAAGDLPDAFIGQNVITTIEIDGNRPLFEPLQDLITQHAPNLQRVLTDDPIMKRNMTGLDGQIYYLTQNELFMPQAYTSMWINQDWLTKLNLKMPTTTDELEQVLIAFRDGDPNGNGKKDEYPMYIQLNGDEAWSIRAFTGAFGVPTSISSWFRRDGDTLQYVPATDGYKAYMAWIAKLHAQGLMPDELATTTDGWASLLAAVGGETPLTGVANVWEYDPINPAFRDQYVTLPPLKGPNGDQYIAGNPDLLSHNPDPKFVLSASSKEKEAVMRFVDQFYIPENAVQAQVGYLGEALSLEDGKYTVLDMPEGMTWDTWFYKTSMRGIWPLYAPKSMEEQFVAPPPAAASKLEIDKNYVPYIKPDNNVPKLKLTEEQATELSIIQTDCDSYVSKMVSEWFMNGGVDEGWDDYVAELKKMGLDRYVEIYQEAYNTQK